MRLRHHLLLLAVALGCVLAACSGSGSNSSSEATDGGASDASTSDVVQGPDAPMAEGGADATPASDGGTDAAGDAATDAADAAADGSAPNDAGGCAVGASGEPLDLACTGLYSDWATKTIAPGVVPYEPGYVLWSDGAIKSRWIELPPGQKIDTSDMDDWTFPVGTKIWKEFSLALGDGGAPTRIETRMLWRQSAATWYRTTYRWSSDGQTSATELTTGESNVDGTTYEIPSQFGCDECHSGRPAGVLGFEAVALSAPAATGLTMAQLVAQGLVTNAPSGSLAVPGDATTAATLGWMHINCGVACHNDTGGMASDTGFLLKLKVAELSSVQATDTYTTGWNQQTQSFVIPDAGTTYRFHACDVAGSAAYYRADHRTGVNGTPQGIQMPPWLTHVVDDADMATLAAWIDEGCSDGGGGTDGGVTESGANDAGPTEAGPTDGGGGG